MADKLVPFFNPSDIVGLGGNWIVQENNLAHSLSRAQGLNAVGDESASKTYDGKTVGSVVLECQTETGNLSLPNVGGVSGGYLVENWSLVYSPTGWPRLTINLHNHDDNAHADGNKFAPSLTCPAQFGCPSTLGFSTTDTDVGVRGITYTLGCQHVDENDGVGAHLAGASRDGAETLAVEFTKVPADMTGPADWDEMGDDEKHGNTAAETASYNWEHHVARSV